MSTYQKNSWRLFNVIVTTAKVVLARATAESALAMMMMMMGNWEVPDIIS